MIKFSVVFFLNFIMIIISTISASGSGAADDGDGIITRVGGFVLFLRISDDLVQMATFSFGCRWEGAAALLVQMGIPIVLHFIIRSTRKPPSNQ